MILSSWEFEAISLGYVYIEEFKFNLFLYF